MRTIFDGKASGATVNEVFDFLSLLAVGETISTASVGSVVYRGSDASPSAIVSGSASISGSKVTQAITAGTLGVTYLLACTVTTSGSQTLLLEGFLTIVPGANT